MVRGIKFTGIPVRDQDVALKFYTETMGFKVITDQLFTITTLDRAVDSRRGDRIGSLHPGGPRAPHR